MLLWLEKPPEKRMKLTDKRDKLTLRLIEDKMLDNLNLKDKLLKLEKLPLKLGSKES